LRVVGTRFVWAVLCGRPGGVPPRMRATTRANTRFAPTGPDWGALGMSGTRAGQPRGAAHTLAWTQCPGDGWQSNRAATLGRLYTADCNDPRCHSYFLSLIAVGEHKVRPYRSLVTKPWHGWYTKRAATGGCPYTCLVAQPWAWVVHELGGHIGPPMGIKLRNYAWQRAIFGPEKGRFRRGRFGNYRKTRDRGINISKRRPMIEGTRRQSKLWLLLTSGLAVMCR
jgi:hypothetical protein